MEQTMIIIDCSKQSNSDPIDVSRYLPALQLELTEIAIRGKGAMCSHQEWPLLRVQRRIIEGRLKPSDVEVRIVVNGIVHNIRLDSDGEMLDPWPGISPAALRYQELYGDDGILS